MSAVLYLNAASAALGFVAAGLWFYSTVADVEAASVDDVLAGRAEQSMITASRFGRDVDVLRSAAKATIINRYAAGVTGAATLFAALAMLLQATAAT